MEANAASDYHPKAKIGKCEEIMEIRGLRTREVARYRHLYDILDCDDSLKLPSMKTNFPLGLKKSNLNASKASEHPRSGEKVFFLCHRPESSAFTPASCLSFY